MTSNDFSSTSPSRDDAGNTPLDPTRSSDPLSGGIVGTPAPSRSVAESEDRSTSSQAVDAAKDLAHEGQDSAGAVMDSAKQEASMVAEQAKDKAADLLGDLGNDVREQAAVQQRKVAANLRDISDEFRSMLDSSQATGTASTLVDQAAHHSGQAAQWLDTREPGDLVEEVKSFARRRPGAFLGIALGAGLLAGRITRNAGSAKDDSKNADRAAQGSAAEAVHDPRPAVTPIDEQLPPVHGGGGTIGAGGVGGTGLNPGVGGAEVGQPGTGYGPPAPRNPKFD